MDLVIPEITIYDKIYIKKDYISDRSILLSEFSYATDDAMLSTFGETDEYYTLGVGCLDRIKYTNIVDKRVNKKLSKPITFKSKLHPAQQRTLDKFKKDNEFTSGILKARCGWGKSFMATGLICQVQEPTLILCHTKLLLDQWSSLIRECTDFEPGIIGDGIYEPKEITVGLYISVNNKMSELHDKFSRVIVDEAHRCGADLFSTTLNSFGSKYKNGMSATPTRRDSRHLLFPDYFTNLFIEAEEYRDLMKPFVEIKKYPLKFEALNPTRDWAKALTKVFSNQKYLDTIVKDTIELMSDGRTCVIIAPRVAALEYMQSKIPRSLTLMGKDKNRDEILGRVGKDINCILTTTLLDEAISCHPLDTLLLIAPNGKDFGKLEQRIGRLQRELPEKQPILVRSYWLTNFILEKQQRTEYLWYNAQGYQTRLIN